MQENEIQSGAVTILSTCAGLKEGEKLLIAFDSTSDKRVDALSEVARKFGAKVQVSGIQGPVTREPPEDVAKSMLENDVTIFCVKEQRTLLWGHADAKVAACKNGGRILFLTQSIEVTPNSQELEQIRARSQKLGGILEKTSAITLLTAGESRLDIKLVGRKSLKLSSILTTPGSWGAVPDYAEAAVAPLESGSSGRIRVDGIIVSLGRVSSPVDLVFEAGKLVKISDGKTARDFENLLGNDPSARVLCELGFGTNHLRRDILGEFDDKKALGTVHIALGDNHTFGGENRSSIHIDCLLISPKVLFDGQVLDLKSM